MAVLWTAWLMPGGHDAIKTGDPLFVFPLRVPCALRLNIKIPQNKFYNPLMM